MSANRRRRIRGLAATSAALLMFLCTASGKVAAQQDVTYWGETCANTVIWGRKDCVNYISGQTHSGEIPPFHNDFFVNRNNYNAKFNFNTYTNTMQDRLFNGDIQDQVSAMLVINIMLGRSGPSFNGDKAGAIAYAKSHFNDWQQLVSDYDKAGRVDWEYFYSTADPYENSAYDDAKDDIYHFTLNSTTIRTIRFRVVDGRDFFIQYGCGNPIGEANLNAGFKYTPGLVSDGANPPVLPNNGASTSNASSVAPGQTVKFDVTVKNDGDQTGPQAKTQVKVYALDPNSGQTYYYNDPGCGGSCYNSPANSTAPQKGIVYSTGQGIIYNPNNATNVPALDPGQTFVGPPNSPQAAPRSVNFTIPADAPIGRKYCFYSHVDPGSPANDVPTTNYGAACFIVDIPFNPACSGAVVTPNSLDPGTPYTISASVRYGSDPEVAAVLAEPSTRFFVTVSGPGVNTALSFNSAQITRSGLILTATTPQQPATGQTGTYKIGYGITGKYGAINCGTADTNEPNPPHFDVTDKPYFTVSNGDISAGAGMSIGGSECAAGGRPANGSAGIVSWNRGAAGGYVGAGTMLGALALGHLQDFATGQGSAYAPSGVSFANTGGDAQQVQTGQGLFGGEFGGTACTGDYFKDVDPSLIQGSQTIGGQAVPNCTGSNQAQCHKVVYVDGDVYINGNITFSGNYASASEIPSFAVVVRGNIYIAPGVSRLDGFYVAQPKTAMSTDGVIYTCAPSPSVAAPLDTTLAANCKNALAVNGAFVARQVWLLRTAGTLSATPAESFNYAPELWLSAPFGNGLTAGGTDDYDAITSLPPVL